MAALWARAMTKPELISNPFDQEETILIRNVDLARRRLMCRGDELDLVMRQNPVSRKERVRMLRYAMGGVGAAYTELRDAVSDLADFDSHQPPQF